MYFYKVVWITALLRQARVTAEVFSAGESEASAMYLRNPTGRMMDDWKKFLSGVQSANEADMMDLYKKVLAVESGGRVFPASQDLVQQMNESLRGQSSYYTLTFDPPPAAHDEEYHSIEVKLGRSELTAHTNTGYYDQPYYTDSPRTVAQKLTVEQLDQQLKQNGGKLSSNQVELSERVSGMQLETLLKEAHDSKTRDVLELAADEAELNSPPAADIIADQPPPAEAQQKMLSAASDYLNRIIPKLPSFTAVRRSTGFGETAAFDESGALYITVKAVPLHVVERSEANALYRQGDEIIQVKGKDVGKEKGQIYTHGTFGPVLQNVQAVLAHPESLSWSRWEQIGGKRLAVFRDTITSEQADYRLSGCCLIDSETGVNYELYPPYKGELAIDPDSGAIFRVVIENELGSFVPIHHNDLVIDYGPVEVSGHTFILPLRSVNILRTRTLEKLQLWDQSYSTWGPYETRIEAFSFDTYHVFHASAQIRPGFGVVPDPNH